MTTNTNPKKPDLKEIKDWHPSDVKAALEKVGWSLRQLGFHNGYTGNASFSEVFRKPWPKVERIIADALGTEPKTIWPTRYNADGTTNRKMGPKPRRPSHIEFNSLTKAGNTQSKQAA